MFSCEDTTNSLQFKPMSKTFVIRINMDKKTTKQHLYSALSLEIVPYSVNLKRG